MTIHQLKEPCWAVIPRLSIEDGDPCYETRGEALAAIREAWDSDRDWTSGDRVRWRELRFRLSRLRPGAPRPRRADACCWLVQCDGECETVLDTEDEGVTYHHGSATEAGRTVASYEWVYSADGRFVFCEDDAPEGAEVPPPSPAELEAAGQMRLIP